MKKFLLIPFAALLITSFWAFEPANENEAIKEVIEKETTSYLNRDLTAWATCFAQDDNMVYIGAMASGPYFVEGWKNLQLDAEAEKQKNPGPFKHKIIRSNMRISQSEKIAFVTFDQSVSFDGVQGTTESKEIRCMKKMKNKWKIVASSFAEINDANTSGQQAPVKQGY